MNWNAISAIGEAIGAMGVIASLLYLAVQIRSDAKERRAATVNERSGAFREFLRLIAENADLSAVLFRGIQDFGALERTELPRFSALLGYLFRVYEENFFQWKEGNLDPHVWYGLESPVDDILAYPGVQKWWATRSHWYSEEFQAFVHRKISTASTPRLYGESTQPARCSQHDVEAEALKSRLLHTQEPRLLQPAA